MTGCLEPIELFCKYLPMRPWQTIVRRPSVAITKQTAKVVGAPSSSEVNTGGAKAIPSGSSPAIHAKDNPLFVVYIFTQSTTSGHQIFTKFLPYLPKNFFQSLVTFQMMMILFVTIVYLNAIYLAFKVGRHDDRNANSVYPAKKCCLMTNNLAS